ncbi:hypothetical protein SGUI_1720 [Serinicoccus hydrothermalis]|uniref:Uncharacterized protein n=1 Tax=Serinicoccus hydrothermalis TaxID=1758689 RepID=A0A1B1NCG8_9MICO|nr:hypothetical protein [Serinicoccus hydrothermalis]ANS79116.1 hypothetical protein SGUI_1720 [Serinicoccus hydrothermalis]
METTHRLLSGEAVRIEVPDAVALPGGTALGVLALEGQGQLEVTSGRDADLAFYLEVTGTTLDREVSLRDGRVLRHGRFGGDPQQGLGWAVAVGEHQVYGFTVPTMDLETLTGFLADVDVQEDALGPVLSPSGRTGWSPYRTQTVAQVVELSGAGDGLGGAGYLLDVRRARTGQLQDGRSGGAAVRGGRLSRSSDTERHPYAVLESSDFVSYGMPGTEEIVDAVVSSLSEVVVELVP